MTIFDQYETEPITAFSGSAFDAVIWPDFRNFGTFNSVIQKLVVGSMSIQPTLLAITGSEVTTASLRLQSYNSNTSSISIAEPVRRMGVLTSDLLRLFKNGYVGSSPRYTIAVSPTERFSDSVMPDPIQVYLSGAVDPTGSLVANTGFGFTAGIYRTGGSTSASPFFDVSSYMILCGNNPVPGWSTASAIPASNLGFGNQVWAYDFPFEPKYRTLRRNAKIENQIQKTPKSFLFMTNGGFWNVGNTNTALADGLFRNSLAYFGYSEIAFNGSAYNYTSFASLENISRSFYALEEFAYTGSLTPSISASLWVSGVNRPPLPEQFYLNFFGFGKLFGKFALPGIITASYGFGAATQSNPARQFPVATGTFVGVSLDGYKFGVYSPIPAYSKAIFKRNHFGSFRDMLEQRPNTTFFDEKRGKGLESAVLVNFLTTSQAYLTASSPDPYLNSRSSGMFDFNYRAGRPFFE